MLFQPMTPERWNKITDLFTSARDCAVAERDEFLSRECSGDAELQNEVEKLLGSDSLDDSFLEDSAVAEAASFLEMGEADSPGDLKPSSPRFDMGSLLRGRYYIDRLIGHGGMGEVYLATDTRINRKVALKVLQTDTVPSKESLRRFALEAQSVSALNHPHIITIYEFDYTDEGTMFIVAEYVDGQTLNHLIGQRLPLRQSLDVAMQVASALSAAHEAGITHRDIKPENIMVRRDGYVKVLDFGLAKLAETGTSAAERGSEDPTVALRQTMPGAVMGTASYMSPEQARGIGVDARSDVWSLGVVVYEMITGRRPFSGTTTADIIVSVLSTEPASLNSHITCPPELEWIVSKALSKDVENRYQTAKGFRADLDRVLKQIEFDSSLRSGAHQLSEAEDAARTDVERPTPTAGDAARATDGGAGGAAAFWSSPNLKSALGQARSHRVGASVVSALLIAVISTAVYFAFLTPKANAEINSIAVLPFENLSGNPDLNYAAEGMSEALIDRLSQVPHLKVIARSSSFKFRGNDVDLRDAASQMNARAIVTGSVMQIGDELVIRIDIVDAAENKQLMGAQYRRKAKDLLAIQSEIAKTASEQLRLKLTPVQSQRLTHNGTEDSEAFRYYLSGLVLQSDSPDTRERARKYFEKAIELDPDFALAHAEIALVYWNDAIASNDPNERMPKARAAAERALLLDPNLSKAHAVIAMVHEYDFDWAGAEAAYRRAIELSPNSDFARNNYALFLSVVNKQDEAIAQLEEQYARDPLNQRLLLLYKGLVLVQARRFDEALQVYQQAQAVDPTKDIPDFILGYTYAGKGLHNEAIAYYKKSIAELGGEEKYSQPLVHLAATYAKMPKKRAEARAILTRIEAMSEYVSPALLAVVYAALDENDRAITLLEQAYIRRDLLLRYIATGYEYDSLRDDPRFIDLLGRTGLSR